MTPAEPAPAPAPRTTSAPLLTVAPSSLAAPLPWKLLAALAFVPALIAVAQLGRIHPDEVYQALEPAYWKVHGYGILAWEWREGIRNWSLPLVLAALLKLCALLHVDHPLAYRAVLELPQLALHLASLVAVYRYALRRSSPRAAAWATAALGVYGPLLTFAGRTMSESVSTSFFLLAVELLDRPRGEREDAPALAVRGGLMLGLTVVARYGSAVLVVGALVWLLATRRFRAAAYAAAGGAVVAGGLALLDLFTWGKPLHSFFAYLDFNVLSGRAAAQFGASPPAFYVPVLLTWAPVWAWLGVARALRTERPRVSLPLCCAALYTAAVCLTSHKEERFLYPALVLFALAGAPALFAWLGDLQRTDLRTALSSLVLCASFTSFFVMPELRGDQFRAIVKATRPAEVTGLLIVNEGIWGAGGSFYIGKNIPWTVCDFAADPSFQAAMADARFNRVVTFEGRELQALQAHGFRVLGEVGRETILGR